MFAPTYFAPEYFAPRYFPPDFAALEEEIPPGGGGMARRAGRILRFYPEIREELERLARLAVGPAEAIVSPELLELALGLLFERLRERGEAEKIEVLERLLEAAEEKARILEFERGYLVRLLLDDEDAIVAILLAASV